MLPCGFCKRKPFAAICAILPIAEIGLPEFPVEYGLRGFAFVEMPNDDEAAKAIAGLDGKEAGGRNLKVNEARPKGEGGPPRGPKTFGKGGGRDRFSNEDYREVARQPREPRW